MLQMTDWVALWRMLVEVQSRNRRNQHTTERTGDPWCERAREFDGFIKRRWAKPDSSRQFVLSHLRPEDTVLDIGAGTGAWAVLIAPEVRRVTAVEPSPAMVDVMQANLAAAGIRNVDIVQEHWPQAQVEPHDVALCSHAVYGSTDLPHFIRHMEACTRRTCYLVLRAPEADCMMAQAARHIWGQPHDSPNFTIAYNVLMQMGIYANVLLEEGMSWRPFTFPSLEEALADMKRRFDVTGTTQYDDYLVALLRSQAIYGDGQITWPNQTRSALVYWHIGRDTTFDRGDA